MRRLVCLLVLCVLPIGTAAAKVASGAANAPDWIDKLLEKLPELLQLGAIGFAAVGLLLAFWLELVGRTGAKRFLYVVGAGSAMFLIAELLRDRVGECPSYEVSLTRSPVSAFGGMTARPVLSRDGEPLASKDGGIEFVCDRRIDLMLVLDEMVAEHDDVVAACNEVKSKLNQAATLATRGNEDQVGFDQEGGAR